MQPLLLLAVAPVVLGQFAAYLDYTVFAEANSSAIFPLLQNNGSAELFPMPACGSFILEEATIDDMQAAMSNGTLSSVQICLCYLQRNFQTNSYIKYARHSLLTPALY